MCWSILPNHLYLENTKPARVLVNTPVSVTAAVTRMLLRYHVPIGRSRRTVTYEVKTIFEGIHLGGIDSISPLGLIVDKNIQMKGPSIVSAPIDKKKRMTICETALLDFCPIMSPSIAQL
jgi:hypothetical protein